jgi:selenocysteine-specific elongation factor
VVVDNLAEKHRSAENVTGRLERLHRGSPEEVLEALLEGAERGLGMSEIIARTGWLESEVESAAGQLEREERAARVAGAPLWLIDREHFRAAVGRVVRTLEAFHAQNPLATGLPKELLRAQEFAAAPPALLESLLERLRLEGKVAVEGETVRLAAHRIVLKEDEAQAREKIVAAFEQAGLAVPAEGEVLGKVAVERGRAKKILQILLRERVLVRVTDELVFHHRAIENLKAMLAAHKKISARLSVPQFKDLTGVSRKYAIPLLEYLDRERVTRRAGDERIVL